MAEKYQYLFDAGRTGLEHNDLSEAAKDGNARTVESGLVSRIQDITWLIGEKAHEAVSTTKGDELPEDAFRLPLVVIDDRPDSKYGSLQLATQLSFHPRVIQDRTGFGHLSEEYDVALAPEERFESVTTYMIPQENADTDGLHTLGVQSKGFLVATKPLVVPTPRYRPGIQELHAEVHRLGEVRDLVEGTAVALRRDLWSPNRKPPHKNFRIDSRA